METTATGWNSLPIPERIVFAQTPLSLAVCQVQFSPMLSVSNPTAVAPFQQDIIDQYPLASQIQAQNVQFHVEGNPEQNHASVQSSLGAVNWRFTDLTDTWTVVLTPEFLTLETRAYQDFSEFGERMGRLLGALDKTIHPSVGLRIGLRYVNEIRSPGDEWKSAIRSELLGALAVPQFIDVVAQSIQQLQFRQQDGMRVNLQHGFFPSGSVVAPSDHQSPPVGAFYLLDIDVFQEFAPGELSMKPRVVSEHIQRYHDVLSQLFRWSVTEEYTTILGRR